MKEILLTLTFICFYGYSYTQCPNSINVDTQEELENLMADYPNCTNLSGNLTLSFSSVNSLSVLSQLESVSGTVNLSNNFSLTSLDGLENLSFIGGSLMLFGNSSLSDISALSQLTHIGGQLLIFGSDLESLTGLENVNTVQGISISATDLTNLNALSNITHIEGELTLENNADLMSLSGLENITHIEGEIKLIGNTNLTNLSGLAGLNEAESFMFIKNNNSLIDLMGLNNLSSLDGYLTIENNASLQTLSGLEGLLSVNGHVKINNNDALTSLSGLNNLNHLGITELIITNCNNLTICNIPAFCNFLLNGGTADISNNSGECMDSAALSQHCVTTPQCAVPIQPIPDAVDVSPTDTIIWNSANFTTSYMLQCDTIPGGADLIEVSLTDTFFVPTVPFPPEKQIFATISSLNAEGDITNCAEYSFTISSLCPPPSSINPKQLPSQSAVNEFFEQYSQCTEFFVPLSIGSLEENQIDPVTDLSPLSHVEYLISHFVSFNGIETDLSELENLKSVFNLRLNELRMPADGMTDLGGLAGLETLNVRLEIINYEGLESLNGLTNLNLEPSSISLIDCDSLSDLSILSEYETINGLHLENLPKWQNYEDITDLHIANQIRLIDLPNFNHLSNFSLSDTLSLELSNLPLLDDFSNLSEIKWIRVLTMDNLANLTNLDFFTSLERIDINLHLRNNSVFTDLSGLSDVDISGLDVLELSGNSSLSACSETSICNYLQFLTAGDEAIIQDNEVNCNSIDEILTECMALSVEETYRHKKFFSPNPAFDYIRILHDFPQQSIISIYDIDGKNIKCIKNQAEADTEIDISDLPNGVYFIQLKTERITYMDRLIVVN